MKLNKLASIMGLGLGLWWAAAPVHAASLFSFEDDDIDFILTPSDTGGGLTLKTSGTLAVGDVFTSVFEFGVFAINGVNSIPAGQELTGLAAVQLVQIIGSGPGAQLIFQPYTGGLNSILALGTDPDANVGAAGNAGGGAMVATFLNSTSGAGGDINLNLNRTSLPATNCTSLTDCINQATLGSLFQVDGFAGDPDEFWVATQILAGGLNIGTVLGTNNNLLVANYNAALSVFFNAYGPAEFINIGTGLYCGNPGYIADGCVQFSVSGTVTGGQGLSNGAIAHSDNDAQKYVPEPASLALLGIGLIGLGAVRSRRRV